MTWIKLICCLHNVHEKECIVAKNKCVAQNLAVRSYKWLGRNPGRPPALPSSGTVPLAPLRHSDAHPAQLLEFQHLLLLTETGKAEEVGREEERQGCLGFEAVLEPAWSYSAVPVQPLCCAEKISIFSIFSRCSLQNTLHHGFTAEL